MKLNVIDLFSGCGGLSKGFEEAGFNILLGIDNDKDALATFEQNHNNSKAVNIDLSNIDFLNPASFFISFILEALTAFLSRGDSTKKSFSFIIVIYRFC